MDWEHQERLGLVNQFPDARLAGARKPSCRPLAAPTVVYFDSEEARLRATQYPGYERHKQTHNRLKAKVSDSTERTEAGLPLPKALTQLLAEGLTQPIRSEDQPMTRFCQTRGVVMPAPVLQPSER